MGPRKRVRQIPVKWARNPCCFRSVFRLAIRHNHADAVDDEAVQPCLPWPSRVSLQAPHGMPTQSDADKPRPPA
jgi:hypothetical protein